jgi:protein TonB
MFASWQHASFAPWPARRLAAALAASAVVHALLTGMLPPGGGRGRSPLPPAPISIEAQLVQVAPPPLRAPTPAIEPTAAPVRSVPPVRARAAPPQPARAVEPAGEGSSLGVPDATYYGVRQLDVFPALDGAFDLRYPQRAAADDVKGRVTLLVLIDADGTVNDVSVVDAHPAGYFEDDALRAVRAARFRPALKDRRAVRSRIVIEVNYGGG